MSFPKLHKQPLVVRIHEDHIAMLTKLARRENEPTANQLAERIIVEEIPKLKRKHGVNEPVAAFPYWDSNELY